MWKYTCPKQPNIEYEFHSWTALNEALISHEEGFSFRHIVADPCDEVHEYWDDGEPCTAPKCNFRYIRNDGPPEDVD